MKCRYLLDSIKGLVVSSANSGALSPAEISANQLQVDSAVQSITRIANTTTFDGLNLINGSLDYLTSGVSASAISSAEHLAGRISEPIRRSPCR